MDLRTGLALVSLLVMLLAAAGTLHGEPTAPLAFWSGIVLVLILIERWRYGTTGGAGAPGDVATGERFIDPETGAMMEVMYDEKSGERKYVPVADDLGKRPQG